MFNRIELDQYVFQDGFTISNNNNSKNQMPFEAKVLSESVTLQKLEQANIRIDKLEELVKTLLASVSTMQTENKKLTERISSLENWKNATFPESTPANEECYDANFVAEFWNDTPQFPEMSMSQITTQQKGYLIGLIEDDWIKIAENCGIAETDVTGNIPWETNISPKRCAEQLITQLQKGRYSLQDFEKRLKERGLSREVKEYAHWFHERARELNLDTD